MPNPPTNDQIQSIHAALLSAFNFNDLQLLTKTLLDAALEKIVPVQDRTLVQMTYDLLRFFAAREAGLHQLMDAAQELAPEHELLNSVVAELRILEFTPLPLPEDFSSGDHIQVGDVSDSQSVAVGHGASANVTNIYVQSSKEELALRQERDALLDGTFARLSFEPETVLIPAGHFLMGSDEENERYPILATSLYKVDLPDFRISTFPITNQEYARYIEATKQIAPPELGWDGQTPAPNRRNHPVAGVTFDEALDYCKWLSVETGRSYQLPTEAHWEKAARTDDGRIFPWGNEWQANRCNHNSSATVAVDAFPAQNEYGCHDMIGNVREWTCSLWGERLREPDERFAPPWQDDERNDPLANDQIRRIWRGGGYADKRSVLHCAARAGDLPYNRGSHQGRYGFRVMLRIQLGNK